MDKKELKLKINDEQLRGKYANQINVMHTQYDFVLDFISLFPPEAIVNARIITNPAAVKKIYHILGQNIAKYEEKYGEISVNDDQITISKQVN
ncbi:MAG: DUF3467 domain-containing protein [Spirochaetes bacterium]|nr:DUF3467 domain-containing protein [Spirochaetota bacterium]